MVQRIQHIPIYSLDQFSNSETPSKQFQVEVFDANRHFSVEYPHRHDFYEVLYLNRGSGTHVIDGNAYDIEPPCIFFMSPGQAHKIEFSNDISGYIFIFTAEFFLLNQSNQNRLIEFPFFFSVQQDNPPLQMNQSGDISFVELLFKRGIKELKKESAYSVDIVRSILDVLLNFCASIYSNTQDTFTSGKGHILVKKFFQLVEENYRYNPTVAQFAEKMALTPSHLTQTVVRLTGKTSLQIIKAKQILETKRLLIYTSLSVSEIAHQMHFPDQSYFSRFFKRECGMTPQQFRKESLK